MITKLSFDIATASNTKLASIVDYLKPSLIGGGVLTGAAMLPALLGAFADDENPLKAMASTAKYTLPIGMALGAGTVPISKAENLIKYLGSKIPSIGGISSAITSRPEVQGISDIAKLLGSEVAASGRDLVGLFK